MIYDWNKLLGQKNVWWLPRKSPSPTPGREGEQRREQRKRKEVQQKQVGRMLGLHLMLVGKQEDNSTGKRRCPLLPRTKYMGGAWLEEPLFRPVKLSAESCRAFPSPLEISWRSLSPLWYPLWSLLEVVQPLQGRPTMAQHSYDWVLNSHSWGQKLASPVSHISKATFSNQLC